MARGNICSFVTQGSIQEGQSANGLQGTIGQEVVLSSFHSGHLLLMTVTFAQSPLEGWSRALGSAQAKP